MDLGRAGGLWLYILILREFRHGVCRGSGWPVAPYWSTNCPANLVSTFPFAWRRASAQRLVEGPLSASTGCTPCAEGCARLRYQPVSVSTSHSNCRITISGFDPNRSGGPQVPAPLEVNTCILPILLNPYTNWW